MIPGPAEGEAMSIASAAAAIERDLERLYDGRSIAGLTEAQLLDRVARGDDSADVAFEAIVTRHGPAVLACCRRVLGDTAAAEDAVQATFLVLVRRARLIRVEKTLAPWLLHVARLAALKARQGHARRSAREHRAARPEAFTPEIELFDLRLLVRSEVDRLPGKYRDPVRLCYFEGQTHDEAAAALGWPVGTVRGRLSRARAMLRTRLTRRGLAVTPVTLAAAMTAGREARAHFSRSLVDATLATTSRGAVVEATVAAIAQAVVRGLVAAVAIKSAVLVLAVLSFLSAGAAIAILTNREAEIPRQEPPLKREAGASPRASKVDRYGDPLPEGAIARLGTTRFRHNFDGGNWGTVGRVSYTPDGRSLVTVGARNANVWDIATEHLVQTIEADLAAISADGKTLFAAKPGIYLSTRDKPGVLRAVELSSGRELRRVETSSDESFKLLSVSPDGKSLAVVAVKGFMINDPLPSAIVVYDTTTLVERRRIAGDFQLAEDLTFSIDGRMLAVAVPDRDTNPIGHEPSASSALIYDVATGDMARRFPVKGFGVGSVAFSPDGKTIAAGIGDRTVRLYDLATGTERMPRPGREGAVPLPDHGEGAVRGAGKACAPACLAFSPDGSLLASGPAWDGTQSFLRNWAFITLWDVAAKRELRRFVGHPVQIRSLAFSPDGKSLASSGGEPQARTWNVATGSEIDPRPGHPHGIVALAVSMADGTVFTSGNDDGLVIHWDTASGRALETLALQRERFSHLAVSPDGRTLAISEDTDARNPNLVLWDIAGHKELRRFKAAPGCELEFSPDGQKLAMGLSIYDVASGKRVDGFSRNTAIKAWFTADSRRLISVTRDGVHLWDFVAGVEVKHAVQANLNTWFNAAVSPDGRLVATGNLSKKQPLGLDDADEPDPAIRVRELASGKEIAKLLGHTAQSNNLAFSPDGRMIASVSGAIGGENDPALRVWDVATGRQLRRFSYHPTGANFVAFLPNGRAIVTASGADGMAIVWDVADSAVQRPAEPPDAKTLEALWADLASDDAPRAYRASGALSVDGAVPFLSAHLRPAVPKGPTSAPEVLRSLRAIAALERVASTRAREVLESLARGDSAAPATMDAAAALLRLSRRKSR
jgi:RNA polymerase sigma factor (sigma-70 family)